MTLTADPDPSSPRKIYIKTYGCQMNAYDSIRMADVMAPHGYRKTDSPDEADLIILNTCHIREKAAEKVYSDLGRLRDMKAERGPAGEHVKIAVGGCVGQAEGEEIIRRMPVVDLVIGPQTYHRLPELLAQNNGRKPVELDFPADEKFDHLPEVRRHDGYSAFLTVQEGCDKFCTFCVVPYTRGAEYSRPAADILKEARQLAEKGIVEITLLGQNVNAYHGAGEDGGDWSLARLIREIDRIDGIERIRYTTSHPRDMRQDLIDAHGEVASLMPYLHLPVQAGSDTILKAMNRKHTAEDYLRLMEKLRAARPDIALSGDFIVGFPGETEADFEATLALVREVNYAQAYSFKYSRRPGTPASVARAQVSEEVKTERLARLQALLNEQQRAFNQTTVGKVVDVLFERKGKLEGQVLGKSPYMQSVHLKDAAHLLGQCRAVKITDAYDNSLAGELVGTPARKAA